jgi:long-subunit fatty acid transport protein
LRVSAGGYWEQGAVPDNYSHLDFPSFDRIGVGTGLRYDSGNLQLALSYAHVFQETRTVDERFGKVFQQRPLAECPGGCGGYSGVPVNAGTFETGFDLLSWSVAWRFGGPAARPAASTVETPPDPAVPPPEAPTATSVPTPAAPVPAPL